MAMKNSSLTKPGSLHGAVLALAAIAAIIACASTSYSDGRGDSTDIGPGDVEKIVLFMSGSIHGFIASASPRAIRIERKPIFNRTSGHIDTGIIANAIEESLVKKGVTFLDAKPVNGGGSMSQPAKEKAISPDANLLHLTGGIREMQKIEGDYRIVHYTISMKLINSLSAKVEWTDSISLEKKARARSVRF